MITTVATEYTGNVPNRDDDEDKFNVDMPNMLSHLVIFSPELNEITVEINSTVVDINADNLTATTLTAGYAAESLASSVQSKESAALAAVGINATIFPAGEPFNFGDSTIAGNGQVYRCVGTNVSGDNPLGSLSGNWIPLTIPPLERLITFNSLFSGGF